MIRADENMPELTQEELTLAWLEWQWNYEDDRRRVNPLADPTCTACYGTGTVYDSVDYGSTTVMMPSICECVDGDDDTEFCNEFERYLAAIAAERIDNPTYWPDEDCEDDYDWD